MWICDTTKTIYRDMWINISNCTCSSSSILIMILRRKMMFYIFLCKEIFSINIIIMSVEYKKAYIDSGKAHLLLNETTT